MVIVRRERDSAYTAVRLRFTISLLVIFLVQRIGMVSTVLALRQSNAVDGVLRARYVTGAVQVADKRAVRGAVTRGAIVPRQRGRADLEIHASFRVEAPN